MAQAVATFIKKHLQAPLLNIVWLLEEDRDIVTESWTSVQVCMEAIAEGFRDTMESIYLGRNDLMHLGPQDESLFCLIEPLFALINLDTLEITVGDEVCLTDDEVLCIFQNLPKLLNPRWWKRSQK